jgi:hypothetical protein
LAAPAATTEMERVPDEAGDECCGSGSDTSSLTIKLVSGFISTLLFMYQKIGTTTFTLLNCVPVGDQQVRGMCVCVRVSVCPSD